MLPYIHYIIFVVLYIISGTILTIITTHLWINRKSIKPGLSLLALFFIWIWLTTQFFEYILPGETNKIIFTTIQYIGIYLLPPTWAGFCYQYTTRKNKKAYLLTVLLSIIPIIAIILTFTNSIHNLIWSHTYIHQNKIKIVKEFTSLYYIFLSYAYILIFVGYSILISMIIRKPHFQRRQTIVFLLAALIPLFVNFIEILFPEILYNLELTPVAFSIAGIIIIYFARLRYFRNIPLAQHIVIESMRDLLILVDPENQIIYLNPAGAKIIPVPETTIAGKPLASFLPGLGSLIKQIPIRESGIDEITIQEITYNVSVSPVYNWRGQLKSRVIVLRDITHMKLIEEDLMQLTNHLEVRVIERTKELENTNKVLKKEIAERKKIEEELHDSLTDKTILLSEIHHRVKNNLQIIVSLLKLQKKYIKDVTSLDIFNTAISRIQSIAIIHEKLYKSKDIAHTNFSEYINELSHYILASHSEGITPINLILEVKPIYLDINRSIHCGLIINELVINAIKYAFPLSGREENNKPRIAISFIQDGVMYKLTVKDNGIGVPDTNQLFQTNSLGMKIVRTLTQQLEGTLDIHKDKGTEISILFPINPS